MFNPGEHCVPTIYRYSCHPQQLLVTTPEALLQTYQAQRKHPVFPPLLLALSVSLSLSLFLSLALGVFRCTKAVTATPACGSSWQGSE